MNDISILQMLSLGDLDQLWLKYVPYIETESRSGCVFDRNNKP